MRRRRPWRALWVCAALLSMGAGFAIIPSLSVQSAAEGLRELPEDFLPSLPISSRVLGVGGWCLVGLGFFAAALTALWLSRPREHPLLKPYRPPALFRVPPRSRPRR